MPRKPGLSKQTLSVAVLPETRKMLLDKSEACGQTISDLVQIAVVEKYSPRRGLAKRLDLLRDEAKLILRQDIETYDAKHQLLVKHATERCDTVMSRCDLEWEGSIQKKLIDIHSEFSGQGFGSDECGNKLNRLLFDLGVWCVASFNSSTSQLSGLKYPRHSGGSIWHAYSQVFLSPMFKDVNLAADTAAELQTWTVTPEYLHFVLTHYEMSATKLYDAFVSPQGSEPYVKLYSIIKEADKMYGLNIHMVSHNLK